MTLLIIGAGRAGQRHKIQAEARGFKPWLYDPYVFTQQSEGNLRHALEDGKIEYAVIATPPNSHLYYINLLLRYGVKILCEKPLCAIGQLDEASVIDPNSPVMVAYNYRYHPTLTAVAGQIEQFRLMVCMQHREVPAWGLLLDHCSHDLDIMRFSSRRELNIKDVVHLKRSRYEQWCIGGNGFFISETVTNYPIDRLAKLNSITIDPDPAMFDSMWTAFLEGDYSPGLAEAIKTQELLQQCYDLEQEANSERITIPMAA